MIKSVFKDIKIGALATAVPTKWTPVEEFINDADEDMIRRFKRNTGVEGRYDASGKQTASDFAFAAARAVMEHKNIRPEDVGILIFVTQCPDYQVPATACVLHKRLGLSEDCVAFDVNQGCTGMVYGIHIASSLLEHSDAKMALLLFGDVSGRSNRHFIAVGALDRDDNDAKLFGDAGSAVLLQKQEAAPLMAVGICTDGEGFKAIIEPYGQGRHFYGERVTEMDGTAVFDFAIERPPLLIKELMAEIGTKAEDYDCLALHQANKLIMKQIAKRAGFSSKQNLSALDKFGNTTSASIATALTKYYGEDESSGSIKTMLCGYGIGLSWGAVSAEIDKQDILPLIMTDEYFDDGYADVKELELI